MTKNTDAAGNIREYREYAGYTIYIYGCTNTLVEIQLD
jgi:hypothetical protein